MKIKVLTLSDKGEWEKSLSRILHSRSDVFYIPAYYDLYEREGHGQAECFVYEDKNEIALYPYLKNKINNIKYKLDNEYFDIQGAYGYNGVVSSSDEKWFSDGFSISFNKHCEEEKIIAEFTRFNPLLNNSRFQERLMNIHHNRQVVIIDLNDEYEKIWRYHYTPANRNMIRKARNNQFTIIENKTEPFIQKFFSMYHESMERVKADRFYYFNIDYFRQIAALEQSRFIFAQDNKKEIIAGILLLVSGNYAHYHLSARSSGSTENTSTNYLLDNAVKILQKEGAKLLNLGGGSTVSGNDSLLRFKLNFNNRPSEFSIGTRIINKKVYNEVYDQWQNKFPQSFMKNSEKILGYREV